MGQMRGLRPTFAAIGLRYRPRLIGKYSDVGYINYKSKPKVNFNRDCNEAAKYFSGTAI